MPYNLKHNLKQALQSEAFSAIILTVSFIIAFLLANIQQFADEYKYFISYVISFKLLHLAYNITLIDLVNDGLMTLFFLLISLEFKYHLTVGEYADKKKLVLPSFAAVGGIVIPAMIYLIINCNSPSNIKGWAIPIATDTAFMLGILSFFRKNISLQLRAFVISFSLIDDALAIIILALFYTSDTNINGLIVALLTIGGMAILNYSQVKKISCYLILGLVLWLAMLESGIHGTLAGAVIALLIPIKTNGNLNDGFKKLENFLRPAVNYMILPLFVFANSGVEIKNLSNIDPLCKHLSWGIILGLFLGKQLGIYVFSFFASKYNRDKEVLANTSWSKFYAVSVLGGVGFTLSLFIGSITFEQGCKHDSMRSAVIIGSLVSAAMGILMLYFITRKEDKHNRLSSKNS